MIAQEVSSFSPKGRSASKIGSIYRSGQQTFCASARIASPPGVARVLRGCQHPGCRLAEIGLHGTARHSERLCALPALLCSSGTAFGRKWHRPLRPLAPSRRAPVTAFGAAFGGEPKTVLSLLASHPKEPRRGLSRRRTLYGGRQGERPKLSIITHPRPLHRRRP